MITRAQMEKKIRAMLTDNNLRQCLVDTANRLYKSGGIDPESFGNNYELPKMLLSEALRREAENYSPLAPHRKKEARNLRHF